MRLILSLVLLGTIGIVSCRKKTPLELPDGAVEVSYTCYNGIMDSGEDGVDCGPTCAPCALSLADCMLNENEFSESYTTTITTAFSAGQIVSSTSTGVLVITATNGNKYVKVTFASDSPEMFAAYDVSQFGTLLSNEVRLEYYNGSYLYTGYSDFVHLNRLNGKLSVELCDVYMSTPSLGGYKVADGKLTEN